MEFHDPLYPWRTFLASREEGIFFFSAGSLGFDPLYLADGKKSEFLTQVDLPKGGDPSGGTWDTMPKISSKSGFTFSMIEGSVFGGLFFDLWFIFFGF